MFGRGSNGGSDLNNKPRLILIDLKMLKLSCTEMLRTLKNEIRTKNIPVMVITSSKESPDIELCYQLVVNSYIIKPVEFQIFRKQ